MFAGLTNGGHYIILGQKKSEDPYTTKDLTLFATLSVQAQAILDRIRPHEKLEKDFEANKKRLYDTERMLARSERIASMTLLLQEYNHELRTPLTIIQGEAKFLTEEPRDTAYLKWFQDLILKHTGRAIDIVEGTARLGNPKEREEVPLDLSTLIEDALKLVSLSGVHLIKELTQTPMLKGDQEDLQTVFINIIKNAVEAMPQGGTLTIKTYATRENEESFVCTEISDTGTGIPQENMEKIFEPFFSTHVTKGRGLGLSIAFRIVREHLGNIQVESTVGAGTTVKIQLPAMKR